MKLANHYGITCVRCPLCTLSFIICDTVVTKAACGHQFHQKCLGKYGHELAPDLNCPEC